MTTASYATVDLNKDWHDDSSLGAHVQACAAARGRSFGIRRARERLHAALSPRFFTTVFGVTAVMALLATNA
jgi:hypothetical protein